MPLETGQRQNQQIISIDMGDVKDEICVKCKGRFFYQAVRWKKLSAIQSPTGREEVVSFPALICVRQNCQTVVGASADPQSAKRMAQKKGEYKND